MTKLLLYCTKAKPYIMKYKDGKYKEIASFYNKQDLATYDLLNGKIVAECDFEVEEIVCDGYAYLPLNSNPAELETKGCLTEQELENYFTKKYGLVGYAIHIKNLHIFDTPKKLDDFTTRTPVDYDSIICDSCTNFNSDCKKCRYSYDYQQVIKAPKNMMKVCEWDIEDKILISIKPEDLCKILNGKKTIVVIKKVLKEMLENA